MNPWNPVEVKKEITQAVAYLQDVHGPVEVLDWWDEHGHKRTWAIAWDFVPKAQHLAIIDTLADAREYLAEALDNMDTTDVAIAIMRLDGMVQRMGRSR